MQENANRITCGVLVILLGFALLLDQLGVFSQLGIQNFLGTFWPLFLVVLGLMSFIKRNVTGGAILLGLGVVFQLSELKMFSWAVAWPILLILMGVVIIFKQIFKLPSNGKTAVKEDKIDEIVAFWGSEKKIKSENFKGGDVVCIFGGSDIDLRDAKIPESGAKLSVVSIFGGVDIKVPGNAQVKSKGIPLLGAWENSAKSNENGPVLEIEGVAIFGGVEVRN